MTCIVGVRLKTGVLLAGDTQGTGGYDSSRRRDEKVFRLSRQVACGFTSSYRMGQILRFHVTPPPIVGDEYAWAVTEFVPTIRAAFKEHGYLSIDNHVETGGTFLLAVRDRLFQVESDFQVGEPDLPFDSCGCGFAYALGAMYALRNAKVPPRTFLKRALEAAFEFSAGVGGATTFVETRL